MNNKKKIFYGFLIALSFSCQTYVKAQTQINEPTTNISGSNEEDCKNPEKRSSRDSTCISLTTPAIAKKVESSTMGVAKGTSYITLNLGLNCTTPWGAMVPDGGGVIAYLTPNSVYDYTSKTWTTECQKENRYCLNGTLSGSYTNQSCNLEPTNGSCGSANGQYYTYPTTGPTQETLCNPEFTSGIDPTDESAALTPAYSSVTLNTTTNKYSWTCSGEAGGTTASCQAFRRINGQCGNTINECTAGTVALTSSINNYYSDYSCNCSTSGGITTCTASPTGTKTCTGGYKDTSYSWQCTGINTGTTASCTTNDYDSSQEVPTSPTQPCATTTTETVACDSGYTGNKTRDKIVDSCAGTTTYSAWDTSSCITAAKPTASGSFNKSTVLENGSATFTWSTSGATISRNVDCWGTAIGGNHDGRASGSITVTFSGVGTGWCNVAAINSAGETDAMDDINVTQYCGPEAGNETTSCGSGYTAGSTKTRTTSKNLCTGVISYGTWNTTGCTSCSVNTNETRACATGYTGNETRTKTVNSCTGVTSYTTWNTAGCTATMAKPTASGSFNKSTVASNGSATFSWSTSGATISTNVDCWGAAVGQYRGSAASGSITVTFSGTGVGACNVAAINPAGETDGTDTIDVTAPVVVAKPSVSGSFDTSNGAGSDFVTYDCSMDAYPGSCQVYFDWSTSGGTSTSVSCSGSWGSKSSSSSSGRLTFTATSNGTASCSVSSTNAAGTTSASYSARGSG